MGSNSNGLAPEYQLLSTNILNNLNGNFDPGETSTMETVIRNIGGSPVSYPTFDVTTSDPYLAAVGIANDNAIVDINTDVAVTIEISVSSGCLCWT